MMTHKKEIPKINDSIVIWHDNELKTGVVTAVGDITSSWSTDGLTFWFDVKTKVKPLFSYTNPSNKYRNCIIRGNSFTWYPCVDANIRWALVKNLGAEAWFFNDKEDYIIWLKNEHRHRLQKAEIEMEIAKKVFESQINVELIEFN